MKNRGYTKHILLFLLLSIMMLGSLTACSNKNESKSKKSSDGRKYAGITEKKIGNKVDTAFFDYTVKSAKLYDTYEFADCIMTAEKGQGYLVVEIEIENRTNQNLKMSINDFPLFDPEKEDGFLFGYGDKSIGHDGFMKEEYTLKKEKTVTKSILYKVPVEDEYCLSYQEYYSDGFEGDTYHVILDIDQ